MNLLDILILFILGITLIRGTFRGVIKELSSIVGIFLGFYIACRYYNVIAINLSPWITNYSYISTASFLSLFILTTLSVAFVSLFINHMISFNRLGWISRACGGFFGLLKGGFVVIVFFLVIVIFLPPKRSTV